MRGQRRAHSAPTARAGPQEWTQQLPPKIIDRGTIARPGGAGRARKSRCKVGAAEGGAPMKTPLDVSLAPMLQPIAAPAAELDRLGDEIAELSAHLDAATARLLDLIRDFDAGGGWGNGFRSCAEWLSWRVGLDPARPASACASPARS